MKREGFTYVLVTASKNEELFIEKTIKSVVKQTILPLKWIIINDGSKDNTEKIVRAYCQQYPFIELINKRPAENRSFSSKADAVNLGALRLKNLPFDFIGNLDADISFEAGYYEFIMQKFASNPKLGIAGGVRMDRSKNGFIAVKSASNSVGGPFQFFRKKCWEEIGGYMPLEFGGIDAVAEITARMKGWRVKSYPKMVALHHRATGTAQKGSIVCAVRSGIKEYKIGYHPLFHTLKSIDRMQNRPYVIRGLLQLIGFLAAAFFFSDRPVSDKLVDYLRYEQLARIRNALSKA